MSSGADRGKSSCLRRSTTFRIPNWRPVVPERGEISVEKEKILQRYRQEGVDEGREEVNRRGDDAGFYAMCVLALLLMIYQAFTGQVFGDVAAMLFVFCSVGAFGPVPD